MADGSGLVGRLDIVEPRRGNRRWPDDVKAGIVADSFLNFVPFSGQFAY